MEETFLKRIPELLAFKKSGNLGRGWERLHLWDRLGRTRICFQLRAPASDPITERLPTLAPSFESELSQEPITRERATPILKEANRFRIPMSRYEICSF